MLAYLVLIGKAFAGEPTAQQGICNPVLPLSLGCGGEEQGGAAIGAIISGVVSGMFIIAFLVAFIYLLTGGFHWITSSGDKANLEHARNKIIHALVGLVVVASGWAVASLAADFFCLDLARLPIPTIGTSRPATCRRPSGDNGPIAPGDCSYAKNGEYACYTTTRCVQCVEGSTVFDVPRTNCAGMSCGQ